jgi:hypothetical protein
MKHFLCPNNANHGELNPSPHTPGAYRCPVCNALFDVEHDLFGKSVNGLSPNQEDLYQELISKKMCKIPTGIGKKHISEKFLNRFPRSLLIVGSKNQLKDFLPNQVTTYHELNRINLHAYDKILIDKSTFGMNSFLISNLLDFFQKNHPNKDLYFIHQCS